MNCPIVPVQSIVNCPPSTASLIWLSMTCSYSTLCFFLSTNLKKHHSYALRGRRRQTSHYGPAHERPPLLRENWELPNRWSTDNDDINFPGFLLNAPSNDGESWGTAPSPNGKGERRKEEEGPNEVEVLWFHLKPPRLKGALTASVAVRLIIIL